MIPLAQILKEAKQRPLLDPLPLPVAVAVLAHRIVDATNDDLPTARAWIADFVRQVPVPPVQRA